ncbi:response regulator transcription factor [Chloroflexota bacterium]
MEAKLLIVDDEENVRKSLQDFFIHEGYQVSVAEDGIKALDIFELQQPELIILDVHLPFVDGLEVCKQLRQKAGQSVGIIMISQVKKELIDRIVGLEVGADLYIPKPFETRELLAQIRALHRRLSAKNHRSVVAGWEIVDGYLRFNFDLRKVEAGGKEIHLTRTEFDLLHLLAIHAGKPYSRSDLVDLVWGYEAGGDISDGAVNTCVSKLRSKIEPEPSEPRYILSVHGVGYKFKEF